MKLFHLFDEESTERNYRERQSEILTQPDKLVVLLKDLIICMDLHYNNNS